MSDMPSSWSDLNTDDDRAYRPLDTCRISRESKCFYRYALRQSRLGMLLSVCRGSGFELLDKHNRETNQLISAIVYNGKDSRIGVRPQEALFVLVQCLESVVFLMHLLQISRLCRGMGFHPQPMDNKIHYRLRGKGIGGRQLVFTKRPLIRDVGIGMDVAGCSYLAEMWYLHYSVVGHFIRNSLSHSTYLSPDSEAEHDWVFEELYLDDDLNLQSLALGMTMEEFNWYVLNVINLRTLLFGAYKYITGKIENRTMDLKLCHPVYPGEYIDCTVTSSQLKITNFRKPLWPRRTDI